MNIKVSGITSMKQLVQLDGLDIDYAGLDFNELSPAFIGNRISPDELKSADLDIKRVGLFKDAGYNDILKQVSRYGLDVIQLNGNEQPDFCEALCEEVEVIKTFRLNKGDSFDDIRNDYDEVCDYYLLVLENSMQSGDKFNWLKNYNIEKPFFLAGSIMPADGPDLKKFRHPDFFGADLGKYFEKQPGMIDMSLLLGFIQSIK